MRAREFDAEGESLCFFFSHVIFMGNFLRKILHQLEVSKKIKDTWEIGKNEETYLVNILLIFNQFLLSILFLGLFYYYFRFWDLDRSRFEIEF